MNKVILKGNVTSDIETRVTANELEIAKFGLAINEVRGTGADKKEKTTFIDVTAFGKRAGVIAKHINKGDPVLIEGRLHQDRWETEQGEKRQKLGVILDQFEFLHRAPKREQSTTTKGAAGADSDTLDEKVPF